MHGRTVLKNPFYTAGMIELDDSTAGSSDETLASCKRSTMQRMHAEDATAAARAEFFRSRRIKAISSIVMVIRTYQVVPFAMKPGIDYADETFLL